MTRLRSGPHAAARRAGPPKRFTFPDETRRELAQYLRRPLRDPALSRKVIAALEARAGEFLEFRALSVLNSDSEVREALRRLEGAITDTRDAIRTLPPRARDALFDFLPKDKSGVPLGTPFQIGRGLSTLRVAILAARSQLAVNPKGGRPVDHRGQRFAADLALIYRSGGGRTNLNAHGDFAEIVRVVFAAIGRETGDMGTLLKGVQRIVAGQPPKTF